jgi:hypothetical protein
VRLIFREFDETYRNLGTYLLVPYNMSELAGSGARIRVSSYGGNRLPKMTQARILHLLRIRLHNRHVNQKAVEEFPPFGRIFVATFSSPRGQLSFLRRSAAPKTRWPIVYAEPSETCPSSVLVASRFRTSLTTIVSVRREWSLGVR